MEETIHAVLHTKSKGGEAFAGPRREEGQGTSVVARDVCGSFVQNLLTPCPQRKINELLKDKWLKMTEDDKEIYREWSEWDRKRFMRDRAIYKNKHGQGNGSELVDGVHVPKKRKSSIGEGSDSVPKKKSKK